MLNKIFIMGRITKNMELRRTNNGTAVTSFTLAVDRDFKDKDGGKETDFIECVAWRQTAEIVCRASKGDMIVVTGPLQNRKWQDKEGVSRTTAEVQVERVYFTGGKKQSNQYPSQQDIDEIQDNGDLPF